jgi:hypothetical protein
LRDTNTTFNNSKIPPGTHFRGPETGDVFDPENALRNPPAIFNNHIDSSPWLLYNWLIHLEVFSLAVAILTLKKNAYRNLGGFP